MSNTEMWSDCYANKRRYDVLLIYCNPACLHFLRTTCFHIFVFPFPFLLRFIRVDGVLITAVFDNESVILAMTVTL